MRSPCPGPEEIGGVMANRFFEYPGAETVPAPPATPVDLGFLVDAGDAVWKRLLDRTEMLRFRPGETVFLRGATERAVYVVGGGTFASGTEPAPPSTPYEPGMALGIREFFTGRPRGETVTALTEGELFRLDFDAFEALAAHDPALGRLILLELGRLLAA